MNSNEIPSESTQEGENWGATHDIPKSLGYTPRRNSYCRGKYIENGKKNAEEVETCSSDNKTNNKAQMITPSGQ